MINRAVKLFIIRHFRNLSPTKTQCRGQHRQITGCLCTRVACKQKLCAPCNARVPATSSIKRRRSCTYRGQKLSGSTRARRSQREMACQRPQRPPPSFFVNSLSHSKSPPARQRLCFSIRANKWNYPCPLHCYFFSVDISAIQSPAQSQRSRARLVVFAISPFRFPDRFPFSLFPIVFPFPFSRSFSLFPFPFSLFPWW